MLAATSGSSLTYFQIRCPTFWPGRIRRIKHTPSESNSSRFKLHHHSRALVKSRSWFATAVMAQQAGHDAGDQDRKIVIIGGGIIGASIAYFLSLRGVPATIIERCGVACAASGKAGGFLALDWTDGQSVGPLTRRSFQLHAQLADELPQDTGYRRINTWEVSATAAVKGKKPGGLPEWLDGNLVEANVMADQSTTAQVHPALLTQAFVAQAKQNAGTQVRIGTAEGVELSEEGDDRRVAGVRVDGEVIPATDVVVAMGPWSGQAAAWFPIPQISGSKATSIVLRPDANISADMLFTQFRTSKDGSVYICGEGDSISLPDDPAAIEPTPEVVDALKDVAQNVSSRLAKARLEKQQACYLPISPDGNAIIGAIPGTRGAYIASGHSCWGILLAPGTGEVMSEIILDGEAKAVDVSALAPARFMGRRGRVRMF